jgi:uncharacterized protein
MNRHRLAPAVVLAAAASIGATALSGCLGGHDGSPEVPHARTTEARFEQDVRLEDIVYSSSDGSHVPAVFVAPRGVSPRGCLIWQNGLSSRAQGSAPIWHQAARLGLAVFSIDLSPELAAADPRRVAVAVRESVADLGRGVDYLERRRECRKNIGYAGRNVGGMIGSVLAGSDARIRATVIISTPPTWRSFFAASDLIPPHVHQTPAQLRTAERILSPLDPMRWITRISPRPVMVLSGREDPLVPTRAAAQLASAARLPKRIVNYRGSDPFRGRDAPRTAFLLEDFLLGWLVKPTYG